MKSLLNMLYDYAIDSSIIKYNVSRNVRNISYKKFAQPKKKTAEEQIFMGKEETSVIELAMKQYKKTKNVAYLAIGLNFTLGLRVGDDDDKIRLNQRKPSKYKGLSRFGPEKNLQRINKFMKERPTFYKKLIQMKENFRFYLRCFYCITKVVILQFNSEKQDRISS